MLRISRLHVSRTQELEAAPLELGIVRKRLLQPTVQGLATATQEDEVMGFRTVEGQNQ
ncbi:hypothetical protein D3C72_2303470 [compost metagenome]